MNNYSLANAVIKNFTIEHYDELMNRNTKKDQDLFDKLIMEVSQHGYKVDYYEIENLVKTDKCLIPVLMNYIEKFDNPGASSTLMRYLGHQGFDEATELMLNEFRRVDVKIPENRKKWESQDKSGYRESASVALKAIRDRRFIDEYIELIENPQTHNDTFNIIELLGVLKVEKAIPHLLNLLHDPNVLLKCASIKALSHFKNKPEIILNVEPFLASDNNIIKKYATKTLRKITDAK